MYPFTRARSNILEILFAAEYFSMYRSFNVVPKVSHLTLFIKESKSEHQYFSTFEEITLLVD